MRILTALFVLFFSSNIISSTDVVNKVFPATVLITAEDKNGQPQSLGSGFLVAPNIIATNFHVIENSYSGYVKFVNKDEIYEIEGVVGYSSEHDLALIKISDNNGEVLPLISIGVDIGQKIFAFCNPLGLEGTISDGIISGMREFKDFSILQISAPISPGNSGGPVVNENGDVVGVATFTFSEGQNINFAVPIKYLKELLNNQMPIVLLSSLVEVKSNSTDISNKSFEGVSVGKFSFNYDKYELNQSIKFSLKNNLRKKICKVSVIMIFYDEDGEPIDYVQGIVGQTVLGITLNSTKKNKKKCENDFIKPKLAKRESMMFSNDVIEYMSGNNLITNMGGYNNIFKYIEFRILDFEVGD